MKILQIFAKLLLNFSPTTDRAPTTFRLLSTTGREACRRWEDLREEAESLESTHSCSFDGGGKGRVSNNCIVSLQSVFAVITENWMFLPSPKKRREELGGGAPARGAPVATLLTPIGGHAPGA